MDNVEQKKDNSQVYEQLFFINPFKMRILLSYLLVLLLLLIIIFWNTLPEHKFIFAIPALLLSTVLLLHSRSKYSIDTGLFIANTLLIMVIFATITTIATYIGMSITMG